MFTRVTVYADAFDRSRVTANGTEMFKLADLVNLSFGSHTAYCLVLGRIPTLEHLVFFRFCLLRGGTVLMLCSDKPPLRGHDELHSLTWYYWRSGWHGFASVTSAVCS